MSSPENRSNSLIFPSLPPDTILGTVKFMIFKVQTRVVFLITLSNSNPFFHTHISESKPPETNLLPANTNEVTALVC